MCALESWEGAFGFQHRWIQMPPPVFTHAWKHPYQFYIHVLRDARLCCHCSSCKFWSGDQSLPPLWLRKGRCQTTHWPYYSLQCGPCMNMRYYHTNPVNGKATFIRTMKETVWTWLKILQACVLCDTRWFSYKSTSLKMIYEYVSKHLRYGNDSKLREDTKLQYVMTYS